MPAPTTPRRVRYLVYPLTAGPGANVYEQLGHRADGMRDDRWLCWQPSVGQAEDWLRTMIHQRRLP